MRSLVCCFLLLLAVAPFAAAASNPAGNWVFVAKPPSGGQVDDSILVKQAEGKFSGAMRLAGGEEIPPRQVLIAFGEQDSRGSPEALIAGVTYSEYTGTRTS